MSRRLLCLRLGAVTNTMTFYVMANPEISSVADLKGKKIGVTRFGASTDFAMRKLLEKYQLKPIMDVPIVQIVGMPEIAPALLSLKELRDSPHVLPHGLSGAKKTSLSASYDLHAGRRALTVEPTVSGPSPSAVTPLTSRQCLFVTKTSKQGSFVELTTPVIPPFFSR